MDFLPILYVQEVVLYSKLLHKMGHYFLDTQYIFRNHGTLLDGCTLCNALMWNKIKSGNKIRMDVLFAYKLNLQTILQPIFFLFKKYVRFDIYNLEAFIAD